MYRKKVSLDQCPNNMIVKTSTPAKYMTIVAPHLAEFKPFWSAMTPRTSGPMDVAASLSLFKKFLT